MEQYLNFHILKKDEMVAEVSLCKKTGQVTKNILSDYFLDVGQVAQMLGLSMATIRKWVLTGYIPYKKIGKAVRFSAEEIQDWVKSKSVSPAKPQGQVYEGGGK